MARNKAVALLILFAVLLCSASPCAAEQAPDVAASQANAAPSRRLANALPKVYLSNAQLGAWMDEFVGRCKIGRKFSVGKSVNGVEFFGLEVSDKPGVEEAEPYYKYIGNMHGNEVSGRMLLPMLAEWLCANNGKDVRATRMVRDMHLFLIPTMNPDGFDARQRENAHGADLNRNFPDPVLDRGSDLRKATAATEPEVAQIMDFILSRTWAASANLHEGSVVVNYPYDGYTSPGRSGTAHLTPDDATFKFLARTYADKNPLMAASREFPGGITNGAQWYDIYGGMQDWNYVVAGCMEVTLEVSAEKFVPASGLKAIWDQNRDSLIAMPLAAALGGVRGRVTGAGSGAPLAATLTVKSSDANGDTPVPFYASKNFGFYARPLAPGTHTLVVAVDGYATAEADVTVPTDGSGFVKNFVLKPLK